MKHKIDVVYKYVDGIRSTPWHYTMAVHHGMYTMACTPWHYTMACTSLMSYDVLLIFISTKHACFYFPLDNITLFTTHQRICKICMNEKRTRYIPSVLF